MAQSRKRSGARTDPHLQKQLDAARGTETPVEAVLSLRSAKRSKSAASKGARERAGSAIERVQREVGSEPAAVNVLENLDIVVVSAGEPFLRKLLEQPEFESAVANAQDEATAEEL